MKAHPPLVLGSILGALALTGCPHEPEPQNPGAQAGEYPQCSGESNEWMGPCCVDIYCVEAEAEGECADGASLHPGLVTGLSLGSGNCACTSVEGPIEVEGEDGCCYTVGIQGCTGRPLPIDGRQRMAPLRRGGSWARAHA